METKFKHDDFIEFKTERLQSTMKGWRRGRVKGFRQKKDGGIWYVIYPTPWRYQSYLLEEHELRTDKEWLINRMVNLYKFSK